MKKSIQEIKQQLLYVETPEDPFFKECEQDERKGVQKLITQKLKFFAEQDKLKQQFYDMQKYEEALYNQGIEYVAGVDEVGRGPLAGPVVAAAVILPKGFYLPGVTDSKKLSESKREQFYEIIQNEAVSVGIGIVEAAIIDDINIYEATKKAMMTALTNLTITPEHVLIDAMTLPIAIPQQSIIKGDAKSISIAASSIIAKVTRDRMMKELAEKHPAYGFEKHMGYGTKVHLEAIEKLGVLAEHRKTFAPIKNMIR
ncbi:ribonuclease HII [Priestia abyssalis]|uniref:ribonuclease HII n=1 Tax=Priestia abyssalis TaxID=1221450 RepID=UPI000994CB45|nr:ribonuclease HII [Priestia abyssalis]